MTQTPEEIAERSLVAARALELGHVLVESALLWARELERERERTREWRDAARALGRRSAKPEVIAIPGALTGEQYRALEAAWRERQSVIFYPDGTARVVQDAGETAIRSPGLWLELIRETATRGRGEGTWRGMEEGLDRIAALACDALAGKFPGVT